MQGKNLPISFNHFKFKNEFIFLINIWPTFTLKKMLKTYKILFYQVHFSTAGRLVKVKMHR